MKKVYVILIIVIVIVIGVFVFMRIKRKVELKVEIKDVVLLHLSYTKGYMMNANIEYELDYDIENNKYFISVKPYLVSEEDKVISFVDNDFREKLKDILIKYQVDKWNGFKKYDKYVLDGDSFHLYVKMEEDEIIEADGYMKWPENYSSVIHEFDELFMKIYNDNKK